MLHSFSRYPLLILLLRGPPPCFNQVYQIYLSLAWNPWRGRVVNPNPTLRQRRIKGQNKHNVPEPHEKTPHSSSSHNTHILHKPNKNVAFHGNSIPRCHSNPPFFF